MTAIGNSLYKVLLDDYSAFTEKTFSTVSPGVPYLNNWHIELISEYLEACRLRKIKRLIINIPPRYLKSISGNVAWPAWLLGQNSSERIISTSYSQALSIKHSLDTRLVVESPWYKRIFPKVELVEDQNTKTKFVTSDRGFRLATSVGGTITGEGGNFLLADDPQNAAEAASELIRKSTIEWFDQSFTTRLDDKKNGVIVVIMQRLHEDDVTGHLLKKGGWTHLKIPAIAQEDILYTFPISGKTKLYKRGEALHDARENITLLEETKRALGSYGFAGQYLQEPAPLEGGIIKLHWFRRFDGKNRFTEIYQSWDTAIKEGQENDYSVGITWGISGNQKYILDVVREKLEYPDLKRRVKIEAENRHPRQIIIEDKASGQQLLQELRRDTSLPVVGYDPKRLSKVERVNLISADVEAGRVYLPKEASWLADFEYELKTFPNSKNDDMVDAFSSFLNWFNQRPTVYVADI